jgi:hypothetical protein
MTSPVRHLALAPRPPWPLRPGSIAYIADKLEDSLEDMKSPQLRLEQASELVALYWLRNQRPKTPWARFVWALRIWRSL